MSSTPDIKAEILSDFDKWRNDGEHCSLDDGALNQYDVAMLKEFLSQAIDRIRDEEREKVNSLYQYLAQLQRSTEYGVQSKEKADKWNLIEAIKEKMDESSLTLPVTDKSS